MVRCGLVKRKATKSAYPLLPNPALEATLEKLGKVAAVNKPVAATVAKEPNSRKRKAARNLPENVDAIKAWMLSPALVEEHHIPES